MSKVSKFVGLDVHKETIAVAVARGDSAAESLGSIPNDADAVVKLVHRLGADDGLWCYEAGPCGYELQRLLSELGVNCIVVAPSLIPTKPGDRVKTDRRDALKLARLLRSGDLTAVWVPDAAHEAFRDLTRARQAAQEDLTRVRHRLTKLLLRLGVRAPATAWSKAYRQWLDALTLPQSLQQHPPGPDHQDRQRPPALRAGRGRLALPARAALVEGLEGTTARPAGGGP